MKTVLATAYSLNPYKGSEEGMGWNFIYQIARFNKVIAVTHEDNWLNIERYMVENPDPVYKNIRLVYFDLSYRYQFWKKREPGSILYYLLWQKALPGFIKKQGLEFDICHNVNYQYDWAPSYLWKLNKPTVWGHIGHHPGIPLPFLLKHRPSYFIKDRATRLFKKLMWKFSPALRKTVTHASYILCMNSRVPGSLRLPHSALSALTPVASEDFGFQINNSSGKFTLISAGRLIPSKGFDLAIAAFARYVEKSGAEANANCELIIAGSGPELKNLKKLAFELGVGKLVTFIPWLERRELMSFFSRSSVFLFPSHEGSGMVVAEALSFGLPVICLDNCGPGEYINSSCGYAVPCKDYNKTVDELSYAIIKLYENPPLQKLMRKNARNLFLEKFNWNVRGEQLKTIYSKL